MLRIAAYLSHKVRGEDSGDDGYPFLRTISRCCPSRIVGSMNNSHTVQIETAPAATEEVRSLVDELEALLSAEYPPEQRHGLAVDAIFQPHVRFFVATLRGEAVGCGGVALFPDF